MLTQIAFLMKNNFFKKVVRMTLVLLFFFANIINVWFNRKQLDSPSCFCIQTVGTVVLVTLPENPGSHRYVAGKGRQNPRGSRTTLGELLF